MLAHRVLSCLLIFVFARGVSARQAVAVWPDLAPGETTYNTGEELPPKGKEDPTITRVVNVTRPMFTVYRPEQPNGTGVVILPGGGFTKLTVDKEGTEAAEWLNTLGITAVVLKYRTKANDADPAWPRALQDAERTMSLIRNDADRWNLSPKHIGLLGFSAGGQVAARLLCAEGKRAYEKVDAVDDISYRPDFAMLIYPWNIYDAKTDNLIEGIRVTKDCPPTFLVHTDDDKSSSLGSTLFYAGLKRHGISAELHVFGNGGHGYGMRPVKSSQISTWPTAAAHWLEQRK